jgi:ABC-type hemin transport system substrate-binding protein
VFVGSHDAPLAAGAPPVPAAFARLETVPAIRDHRVVALDGDLVFRPGPRVVEGLERIAAALEAPR